MAPWVLWKLWNEEPIVVVVAAQSVQPPTPAPLPLTKSTFMPVEAKTYTGALKTLFFDSTADETRAARPRGPGLTRTGVNLAAKAKRDPSEGRRKRIVFSVLGPKIGPPPLKR